jgi:hypothetical protein
MGPLFLAKISWIIRGTTYVGSSVISKSFEKYIISFHGNQQSFFSRNEYFLGKIRVGYVWSDSSAESVLFLLS